MMMNHLATLIGGKDKEAIAKTLVAMPMYWHYLESADIEILELTAQQRQKLRSLIALQRHALTSTLIETAQTTQPPRLVKLLEQLLPEIMGSKQEKLWCVYYNQSQCVTQIKVVAIGSERALYASMKAIFSPVVQYQYAALLCLHNHPFAPANPSEADTQFTQSLIATAHLLEVSVVDHLIVGLNGVFSYRRNEPHHFTK